MSLELLFQMEADYKNLYQKYDYDIAMEFAETYLSKTSLRKMNGFINENMGMLLKSNQISCKKIKELSNLFFSLQTGDLVAFDMIPNVSIKDVYKRCQYEDSPKGCMRKNPDHKRKYYHDNETANAYAINKIGTNLGSFCQQYKNNTKNTKKRKHNNKLGKTMKSVRRGPRSVKRPRGPRRSINSA